jgi:hypothetical protein
MNDESNDNIMNDDVKENNSNSEKMMMREVMIM